MLSEVTRSYQLLPPLRHYSVTTFCFAGNTGKGGEKKKSPALIARAF